MGLQYTLEKNQNWVGVKFQNAYWKITNFGFGEYNNDYVVSLQLTAYPSRESSILSKSQSEVGMISSFGSSIRPIYESALYRWDAIFPVAAVFPNGIPSSLSESKKKAYTFIKEYLSEVPFQDVFEEGQKS